MGEFPSGQRGQTVNLLLLASVVRIHLLPPEKRPCHFDKVFFQLCLPAASDVGYVNDVSFGNDVASLMFRGKHHITASETSNIILSEAKNIISP